MYIQTNQDEVLDEDGCGVGFSEVEKGFEKAGEDDECSDVDWELACILFFSEEEVLFDEAQAAQSNDDWMA